MRIPRWDTPLDIARRTRLGLNGIVTNVERASTYFLQTTVGLADQKQKPGTKSGISLDTVRHLLDKSRAELSEALERAELIAHNEMAETLAGLIKLQFSDNAALKITLQNAFDLTQTEAEEIVVGGDA